MKFISGTDDSISKKSSTDLFNIKGELTDGLKEKVFSKALSVDLGNNKTQKKFFIRVFNGTPLDPFGSEAGREIWNRTELKQVSESTFEAYNNYLLTRNRIFWTKTNRGYING